MALETTESPTLTKPLLCDMLSTFYQRIRPVIIGTLFSTVIVLVLVALLVIGGPLPVGRGLR